MSGHRVTVTVPPSLYEHLQQRAQQRQRSIEDEVVLTLAEAIPDGDDPTDLDATLASLAALDDAALWRLARTRVADEDALRLAELADRRQRVGLTDAELRQAEEIAHQLDRAMVLRAEAAVVLKQRGLDIGSLLAEA